MEPARSDRPPPGGVAATRGMVVAA